MFKIGDIITTYDKDVKIYARSMYVIINIYQSEFKVEPMCYDEIDYSIYKNKHVCRKVSDAELIEYLNYYLKESLIKEFIGTI